MKKAILVSCFNYYQNRCKHIEGLLVDDGFSVEYITSDFDHISKEYYQVDYATQIHSRRYDKNLSISRMISHYLFSRNLYQHLKEEKPDLLFVMTPPNSVAYFAAKYKKKATNTKLIIDVYDLWPETFPHKKNSLLSFLFKAWASFRNKGIRSADVVTVECDLFREKLGPVLAGKTAHTLYLAMDPLDDSLILPQLDEMKVSLAYLGSINNIIDIDLILELLLEIQRHKPVELHIIGAGEKTHEMIDKMKDGGIKTIYHGAIFDDQEKMVILNRCWFGLNIMKKEVCVGLTMKSVDYLRSGLPLLSNIPADTKRLIQEHHVGLLVMDDSLKNVANNIAEMSAEKNIVLRRNSKQLFERLFSPSSFLSKSQLVFDQENS